MLLMQHCRIFVDIWNCHVFGGFDCCVMMRHLFLSVFPCNSSTGFGDLTEDATYGLNSLINRRSLRSQHRQAVNAYSSIGTFDDIEDSTGALKMCTK